MKINCYCSSGTQFCIYLTANSTVEIDKEKLVDLYMQNQTLQQIVCLGEPFDSLSDLINLVTAFRKRVNDDIIIYTKYAPSAILFELGALSEYKNIKIIQTK